MKVNESAADWGLVFDTLLLIAFLQSDAETPEERRARSDKWYAQEWEKLEINRNDG